MTEPVLTPEYLEPAAQVRLEIVLELIRKSPGVSINDVLVYAPNLAAFVTEGASPTDGFEATARMAREAGLIAPPERYDGV